MHAASTKSLPCIRQNGAKGLRRLRVRPHCREIKFTFHIIFYLVGICRNIVTSNNPEKSSGANKCDIDWNSNTGTESVTPEYLGKTRDPFPAGWLIVDLSSYWARLSVECFWCDISKFSHSLYPFGRKIDKTSWCRLAATNFVKIITRKFSNCAILLLDSEWQQRTDPTVLWWIMTFFLPCLHCCCRNNGVVVRSWSQLICI